jgi:hypothetical protein
MGWPVSKRAHHLAVHRRNIFQRPRRRLAVSLRRLHEDGDAVAQLHVVDDERPCAVLWNDLNPLLLDDLGQ